MSESETLLAVQLEQAGIPFEREFRFAPEDWCRANGYVTPVRGLPKKWRADFLISWPWTGSPWPLELLVEIDGGTWIPNGGRHNRGSSIADEYQKGAAAAILGYRVIHCTPKQVENGTCLSWIRQALGMEKAA